MSQIERSDTYFLDGRPYMVGVDKTEAFLDGGAAPPPTQPPPGNGDIPLPIDVPILWKGKGLNVHPDIGNGELSGQAHVLGGKCFLDIFVQFGSTTNFGQPTPYWFFQAPTLMPDLVAQPRAGWGAGSVIGWTGGSENWNGSCWWSGGPGGALKYGIRVAFESNMALSPVKPKPWEKDDRIRISIAYRLP